MKNDREKEQRLLLLRFGTMKDVSIEERSATEVLTLWMREQVVRNVAAYASTSGKQRDEVLDEIGFETYRGGLSLDEGSIGGLYRDYGKNSFRSNIEMLMSGIVTMYKEIVLGTLDRESLPRDPVVAGIGAMIDETMLLKSPFTFDEGSVIVAEAFRSHNVPPGIVGQMISHTHQLSGRNPGGVDFRVDKMRTLRLGQIYKNSLTDSRDQIAYLQGLNQQLSGRN